MTSPTGKPSPSKGSFAPGSSPDSSDLSLPPDLRDDSLRLTLPSQASPAEAWLWRGLLLLLCILAYVPSLSPEFLWDDNRHANAPAYMRDGQGLERIWTNLGLENEGTPQYYPLTHTTFWIEYQVWGRNAIGYRVVNIVIHVVGAVLLWELLRRLRVPGAFLAAAIFALHPVMVESVAWTSERKNTLSLAFGLATLLLYARFAGITRDEAEQADHSRRDDDWNLYAAAFVTFLAAMLSKTMAASFPVIILLMLWWKRKLNLRHLGLIAPMLLVAIGLGLLTGYTEHSHVIRPAAETGESTFTGWLNAKLTGQLSSGPDFEQTFPQRLLMAGIVPWFYASKVLAPVTLAFFYERWDLASAPAWWWTAHLALAAVLLGAIAVAFRGIRWPLAALVAYLIALFPAMGFVDVYPFRYSYVADHFAYHAVWILIAVLAAALALFFDRLPALRQPRTLLLASSILLLAIAARTYVHAAHFIDNYALFTHTLKVNPTAWAAAHNLARENVILAEKALGVERQFRSEAQRLASAGSAGAHEAAAQADAARAEASAFLDEATRLLTRTLELRPQHEWAHYTLANVARLEGRLDDALALFRLSAARREDRNLNRDGPFPDTFANIGEILRIKGDLRGASENYRKAVSLENPPIFPRRASNRIEIIRLELAIADQDHRAELTRQGRSTTGPVPRPTTGPILDRLAQLRTLAVELTSLQPDNYDAWLTAGDLMFKLGDFTEAAAAYQRAFRIRGTDTALTSLGTALFNAGELPGAELAFKAALEVNPSRAEARAFLQEVQRILEASRRSAATLPATSPSTRP
jgi:protein O-mannosyl-transferase